MGPRRESGVLVGDWGSIWFHRRHLEAPEEGVHKPLVLPPPELSYHTPTRSSQHPEGCSGCLRGQRGTGTDHGLGEEKGGPCPLGVSSNRGQRDTQNRCPPPLPTLLTTSELLQTQNVPLVWTLLYNPGSGNDCGNQLSPVS